MKCSYYSTEQTVSIPLALEQSEKGLYFIGQTPIFTAIGPHALVALEIPHHKDANIYLNAITVTNVSGPSISAEVYLQSSLLGGTPSPLVSSANTSIHPIPIPEAQIQWVPSTTTVPTSGVSIFSRIISPGTTVVIDGGQIIVGSGQSVLLYLGGYLPLVNNALIVAFGWWEEPIHHCMC